MPWHTIATMIIVNMCVQCLFNLNFAHVTHINFFLKLNLLVCFFHFFFLCTYVCIYELCMYVCVCACVVVVLYWNIFQWSQVWFLFHESPQKFVFIMLQKKILAILVFIYERRFKNLLFFFHLFSARFIFELSRRLLHTNIFKAIFTFSPNIMFPYYS